MKKIFQLLFLLSLLISVFSCTKNRNDIIIDLGDVDNGGGNKDTTSTTKPKTLVLFNASVESLVSSKAMTALSSGRYAMIWAYNADLPLSSGLNNRVSYKSETAGVLTPVSNPMYLPDNTYNFYSVATNSTTNQNPNFDSQTGISSSTLSNGIDYLWWNSTRVAITSSTVNIPIIYSHCATQIVIKLYAGNGVQLNTQSAATITPSDNKASKMNLTTGVITPSTSLSSQSVKMGVSNFVSQYTMLPLTMSGNLTATFTVTINNETKPRVFSVKVPVPSGNLSPGKSYLYKAVVNANEITFNSVDVIDWIVVDEEGTPLYPTQIQ
ncbi:MAG: fimbrillin family protein [Bacteroidales bacterium]